MLVAPGMGIIYGKLELEVCSSFMEHCGRRLLCLALQYRRVNLVHVKSFGDLFIASRLTDMVCFFAFLLSWSASCQIQSEQRCDSHLV